MEGYFGPRLPTSPATVAAVAIAAFIGALLGITVILIAAVRGTVGLGEWLAFGVSEALSLTAGLSAIFMYNQRRRFLAFALATTIDFEDYFEVVRSSALPDIPRDLPQQPLIRRRLEEDTRRREDEYDMNVVENLPDILDNARDWRDALISNGTLDIAERLQTAILAFTGQPFRYP